MNKCPDYPPADLFAENAQYPLESELMWRHKNTVQVDLANALYVDDMCLEMQTGESEALFRTMEVLRSIGIPEGDISQLALSAMKFTGIDRRGDI